MGVWGGTRSTHDTAATRRTSPDRRGRPYIAIPSDGVRPPKVDPRHTHNRTVCTMHAAVATSTVLIYIAMVAGGPDTDPQAVDDPHSGGRGAWVCTSLGYIELVMIACALASVPHASAPFIRKFTRRGITTPSKSRYIATSFAELASKAISPTLHLAMPEHHRSHATAVAVVGQKSITIVAMLLVVHPSLLYVSGSANAKTHESRRSYDTAAGCLVIVTFLVIRTIRCVSGSAAAVAGDRYWPYRFSVSMLFAAASILAFRMLDVRSTTVDAVDGGERVRVELFSGTRALCCSMCVSMISIISVDLLGGLPIARASVVPVACDEEKEIVVLRMPAVDKKKQLEKK